MRDRSSPLRPDEFTEDGLFAIYRLPEDHTIELPTSDIALIDRDLEALFAMQNIPLLVGIGTREYLGSADRPLVQVTRPSMVRAIRAVGGWGVLATRQVTRSIRVQYRLLTDVAVIEYTVPSNGHYCPVDGGRLELSVFRGGRETYLYCNQCGSTFPFVISEMQESIAEMEGATTDGRVS